MPAGFEMARPILLAPAARDLARLLGRVHDRHVLGPSTDTMPGVHPDVAALEATWAERKGRDDLRSPSDDRTLVERALHPEALGTVVERLGRTAHDTKRRGARSADIRLARRNALDLSIPFFDPEPSREADIGTRLGARDPRSRLPGGTVGAVGSVTRVRVPGWMARTGPLDVEPDIVPREGGLGPISERAEGSIALTSDRWGLGPA